MRRNHLLTRRSGTTIAEIMVVIAIISSLSTLSFVSFTAAKRFGNRIENATAKAIAEINRTTTKNPGIPLVQTPAPSLPQARPERISGQYFVGFSKMVSDPQAEAQRLANLVGGQVRHVYTQGLYGCGLMCDDSKAQLLALDPAVRNVEQARYVYPAAVPNNIKRVHSNGIRGTGPAGFRMNSATATPPRWDQTAANTRYGVPASMYRFSSSGGARPAVPITGRVLVTGSNASTGTTIAILDTGIDNTHPDLNVIAAVDFTGGNNPMDVDGHGTHVAGVVAARDQSAGVGVVGVYPGAALINLKVMDDINRAVPTGNVESVTISSSGFPFFTHVNALRVRSTSHKLSTGNQIVITGVTFTGAPFTSANAPQLSIVAAATNYTITKINSNEFFLNNTNNTTGGPATANTGTWTRVTAGSLNDNAGSNLDVLSALSNYVIPNARSIGVCLMPFETGGVDPEMNNLIDTAGNLGVLMVAAAGNNAGANAKTTNSPSSASQAIVVGAIQDSDGVPYVSSKLIASEDVITGYSNTNADLYAPGGLDPTVVPGGPYYFIRSTIPIAGALANLPAPFDPYSTQINGNVVPANRGFGTSFAAAHVAGMMALMIDPNSQIGFVVGSGGATTSYRLHMTNKTSAVAALTNLTRRTESVQVVNPFTKSMWVKTTAVGPFFNLTTVTPFTIDFLPNDDVAEPGGRRVPIANFYANSGGIAGLAVFPGHSQ